MTCEQKVKVKLGTISMGLLRGNEWKVHRERGAHCSISARKHPRDVRHGG